MQAKKFNGKNICDQQSANDIVMHASLKRKVCSASKLILHNVVAITIEFRWWVTSSTMKFVSCMKTVICPPRIFKLEEFLDLSVRINGLRTEFPREK